MAQNQGIKDSMSYINKQYDDLIGKFGKLETEIKVDRNYVGNLKKR